ncbi:MAG: hypothetical protein ACOZQL_42690 [Myxococcota bacterium]
MHDSAMSLRQLSPFFLGVGLVLGLAPVELALRLIGLGLFFTGVLFLRRRPQPVVTPTAHPDVEVWGDE